MHHLPGRVVLVGWSIALATACGGDEPEESGSASGAETGGCAVGENVCGEACIDLQTDRDHCGECGYACAEGTQCVAGVCGGQCPDGLVLCDNGECVDVSSDPDHCGSCGNDCDRDEMCVSGNCEEQQVECGAEPEPPGDEECPDQCGECVGGTCVIECVGDGTCDGDEVRCPDDWACLVQCVGPEACADLQIDCPPLYSCRVECLEGQDVCDSIQVECSGSGVCRLECGEGDECTGEADLNCGENACTGVCNGGQQPNVDCDESCSCAAC
jgi:hypothetical protein